MLFTLACAFYVEGAFVYVPVGKKKCRLQYPGWGVLSSELWRTTKDLFRDDCFFISTGMDVDAFYFVKFSGHL